MKPPESIASDDASFPTFEDGLRRLAASATEGEARFVGIRETEETDSPQAGQKRAEPGTSDEHFGQRIKVGGF